MSPLPGQRSLAKEEGSSEGLIEAELAAARPGLTLTRAQAHPIPHPALVPTVRPSACPG